MTLREWNEFYDALDKLAVSLKQLEKALEAYCNTLEELAACLNEPVSHRE